MKPCYFSKASAAAVCSLPTEAGIPPLPSRHSMGPAQQYLPQPCTTRGIAGAAGAWNTPSLHVLGLSCQDCVIRPEPRVGGAGCLAAHVLPPQTPTCHGERARKCKQREARNVIWPSPVKNPSYVSACLGGLCLSF